MVSANVSIAVVQGSATVDQQETYQDSGIDKSRDSTLASSEASPAGYFLCKPVRKIGGH
jgi:hypothetical protein